jgi:acyl carrier protein
MQISSALPQAKANSALEDTQDSRVLELAGSVTSYGNGNGSHHGRSSTDAIASRNGSQNGSNSSSSATAIAPSPDELLSSATPLPDLDLTNPLGNSRVPVPNNLATTVEEIDVESLGQSLLEIVSEKTGYPVEMLELDMDIEADLGIDSIKRVEILGAMQERFQSLSQPNLEDLVELRTLGQIVDLLGQESEKKKVIPELMTSPPS